MTIQKITPQEFNEIFTHLENNFVKSERRDRSDAEKLFIDGKFSVYHTVGGDKKVGFITIWHFDTFDYVEHFVTYENYRNQGYGAKILDLLKEDGKTLVLEAELPADEMQKRRISFYQRCGFCINPQNYEQPPYREGEAGVPMLLLSYPHILSDFDKTVSEIYGKVYGMKL